MQTTFEKLGGTYRQVGDYLLPDIEVPESPKIGFWGQRRLRYLRTHKRVLYTTMIKHRWTTLVSVPMLWSVSALPTTSV